MVSMGSGAIAQSLSGFAGLAGTMLPGPEGQGAAWTDKVGNALTYRPKSLGGQNAMKAFGAVPQAIDKVSDKLADYVFEKTGNPADPAMIKTLIQGIPQILGMKGAGALAEKGSILPKSTMRPEVAALDEQGVTMTPGQRGGKLASAAEERLTSWPIAGDVIKSARGKAVEQWNRAELNDAVKDAGGVPIPKSRTAPRDALYHVESEMKRRYGEVLGKMSGELDPQFQAKIAHTREVTSKLDKEHAAAVDDLIKTEVEGKFTNGKAPGDTVKEIQETLRTEADNYRRGGYQDRKTAQAIDQVRTDMSEMLKRVNPKLAPELEGIDKGYAKFKASSKASLYNKKGGGVYSPVQKLRAIEARDKSKDKGRFATGKARGQKEAQDAEKVLGNTVPDSGTAGRGALLETLIHKPWALSVLPVSALASIAYSQPVLRALQRAGVRGGIPGKPAAQALPAGAAQQEQQP
jgi:hypothetical protein